MYLVYLSLVYLLPPPPFSTFFSILALVSANCTYKPTSESSNLPTYPPKPTPASSIVAWLATASHRDLIQFDVSSPLDSDTLRETPTVRIPHADSRRCHVLSHPIYSNQHSAYFIQGHPSKYRIGGFICVLNLEKRIIALRPFKTSIKPINYLSNEEHCLRAPHPTRRTPDNASPISGPPYPGMRRPQQWHITKCNPASNS